MSTDISYHIIDLKRQNRLKVRTNKPKLKVKMHSVSDDDDVRKRLLEKPRFSWGQKVHSDWEGVTSSGRAFQVFRPATAVIHRVLLYMQLKACTAHCIVTV